MTATHFSRVRDSLLYQLRTALSKNSFMTDSGLSLICTTMKLAMLVVVLSCLACATASCVRVRTLSGIGTCLRPLTVPNVSPSIKALGPFVQRGIQCPLTRHAQTSQGEMRRRYATKTENKNRPRCRG